MLRALLFSVAVCWAGLNLTAATQISIVIGGNAPALEKLAADRLAADFRALFAVEAAVRTSAPADAANTILLGSPPTNPAIPKSAWPKLSDQGQVIRSTPAGLVVGGGSPVATLWAASELAQRLGIRPLLHGDALPVAKPELKLGGFDVVLEPGLRIRAWSAFNGQPHGADAWPLADQQRLITQLAKLKFTHLIVPAQLVAFPAIAVDGDTGGRAAFKGVKSFAAPAESGRAEALARSAREHGLTVLAQAPADLRPLPLGATVPSVLPQFALSQLAVDFNALRNAKAAGFVATAVMPGDLNAAAYFVSRAAFDATLTARRSLDELVTPICGDGVSERLWLGFEHLEQAAKLIAANDPGLGVPAPQMLLRHLNAKTAPPAWLTKVKAHYADAMNEMYRGNTRARGGARPYILYHAKRFEFALHYCTALEALGNAGLATAQNKPDARADAADAALEAIYNALNAHADVARDASDRGVIALLNEHGYRPVGKALR